MHILNNAKLPKAPLPRHSPTTPATSGNTEEGEVEPTDEKSEHGTTDDSVVADINEQEIISEFTNASTQ